MEERGRIELQAQNRLQLFSKQRLSPSRITLQYLVNPQRFELWTRRLKARCSDLTELRVYILVAATGLEPALSSLKVRVPSPYLEDAAFFIIGTSERTRTSKSSLRRASAFLSPEANLEERWWCRSPSPTKGSTSFQD